MTSMPFIDLAAQQKVLRPRIDEAIRRVLDHGSYILGPEVDELEEVLGLAVGRKHCVSCASGTDALQIFLMAKGVGPGDRVVVPNFTFVATAEAVCLVGAEPIFADVDPCSYTLDPESVRQAWDLDGPPPVGVIAVDLFGHPARTEDLTVIAENNGAWVLVDGAQSFGARRDERSSLAYGEAATTSFYPAKPLGGYGDGGAIFCDDGDLAETMRSVSTHGAGGQRYEHVRLGLTGRLDTLQAAILLVKLEVFAEELVRRQEVADRYTEALEGSVIPPAVEVGCQSVWAQYTVQVDARSRVREGLLDDGVPTVVFYPQPLHEAPAYRSYPVVPGGSTVTERISGRVVGLPMHPYLVEDDQDHVISSLKKALVTA
jgi:dTDP-4-amino-4,6-dideoxygalactose transaminase